MLFGCFYYTELLNYKRGEEGWQTKAKQKVFMAHEIIFNRRDLDKNDILIQVVQHMLENPFFHCFYFMIFIYHNVIIFYLGNSFFCLMFRSNSIKHVKISKIPILV